MKLMKRMIKLVLVMLTFTAVFAFGCKKDDGRNPGSGREFDGPDQKLGNGFIHAFILLDAQGKPKTLGLKFTESALSGLPTDTSMHMMDMGTQVELPSEAWITGFDHMEIDWNPLGHEPRAVFGLPHFDFHFYLVSKSEQASVIPGPDTVSVPAINIPKDYQSGVIAVPDMGVHWIDQTAPEFHGQKFTDTFIYGFYHGKMTFIEPMITKEFLSGKPDFKINIKQPESFQKSGYYPAVQHIQYDPESEEFVLALEELKYYSGSQNQ
jgi:Domain of unknown function (DUF5602)